MLSQQMTVVGAKYSLRLVLGLVSFLALLSVKTSSVSTIVSKQWCPVYLVTAHLVSGGPHQIRDIFS